MSVGGYDATRRMPACARRYGRDQPRPNADGHKQELMNGMRTFGAVEADTRARRQPSAAPVSRAIATAAKYGFLAAEFCARCLVVPLHVIDGGARGKPYKVCREHTRRRGVCLSESKTGLDVDTESQRTAPSESHGDALTSTNLVARYGSSLPRPGHQCQLGASPEVDRGASAAAGLRR
jgi:hypothetical protein